MSMKVSSSIILKAASDAPNVTDHFELVPRSELALWLITEIGEQLRIDHGQSLSKMRKHDMKSKEVNDTRKSIHIILFNSV